MRKLHMGTMSYGADAMDEVAHQLALAFGAEQSHHRQGSTSTGAQLASLNAPKSVQWCSALRAEAILRMQFTVPRARHDSHAGG